MALAEALTNFTLRIANPLVWHNRMDGWPRRIYGGTCFFLRFANGIVGITANHVVEALENATADNSQIICQIRTSKPVDLPSLIIDRCSDLDIATFSVSEEFVDAIGATAVDCLDYWPPPG